MPTFSMSSAIAIPRFTDGFMRIGSGPFGAKEESLNEHKALLKKYNLRVPRTVTMGWGGLQRYCADGNIGEFKRIVAGAHIALGSPEYLAARSTAMGDNTGTGIFYSNLFRYTDPDQAMAHIRDVAASHSSPEAECFRRELQLVEGIGAMLQPIAGNYYDLPPVDGNPAKRVFGPLWSGIVNTQLPQVLVLNPGLLRPETSENKTLIEDLSQIDPDSRHLALLFDSSSSSSSLHPVDMKTPGNILLQEAALKTIREIPDRMWEIKRSLDMDLYAEICVAANGVASVVQFTPLPPLPRLSATPSVPGDATTAVLCRGATKLSRATALHVTDHMKVEDLFSIVREFSKGMEGRSLVLIFEDNILRELMSQTRELWGALLNVGALFSIDIQKHSAPFECHLAGAMRMARNFGYGRLPQSPNLGDPSAMITAPANGRHATQIDVYENCVEVQISEWHDVGYIRRCAK